MSVYFESDEIIMYPVANRDATNFRDSRVSTEHNIVAMLNKAISRSYIVDGLTIENGVLQSGSAVIGGYIVDILGTTGITLSPENNAYLCLSIEVDTSQGRGEVVAMDGNTSLDSTNYYYGLRLINITQSFLDSLSNDLSYIDGTNNTITYYLPIAQYVNGAWDNLYCLNGASTGERIYGLKYLMNDIVMRCSNHTDANYGTSHPVPLGTFLENYLVLDDGYVEDETT